MADINKTENDKKSVSRRDFLKSGSAAIAAGALGVYASQSVTDALADAKTEVSYLPSKGYIVHDSRLCFGCQSCMYACSMAHEGVASPSLSRIQILSCPYADNALPRCVYRIVRQAPVILIRKTAMSG